MSTLAITQITYWFQKVSQEFNSIPYLEGNKFSDFCPLDFFDPYHFLLRFAELKTKIGKDLITYMG